MLCEIQILIKILIMLLLKLVIETNWDFFLILIFLCVLGAHDVAAETGLIQAKVWESRK